MTLPADQTSDPPTDRIDLAEGLEADSGSLQGLLEWHTSHVHFYEEQSDEERAGFHRNMCDWLSSTVASCSQAASTIRSLSKALEEAREGLKPFAEAYERLGSTCMTRDEWEAMRCATDIHDYRRAASVLSNIDKTLKGEQS